MCKRCFTCTVSEQSVTPTGRSLTEYMLAFLQIWPYLHIKTIMGDRQFGCRQLSSGTFLCRGWADGASAYHRDGGVQLPDVHPARRMLTVIGVVWHLTIMGRLHGNLGGVGVQVDELLTWVGGKGGSGPAQVKPPSGPPWQWNSPTKPMK